MSTDGVLIFSYNLLIGYTTKDGDKVALLYNAPSNCFESKTTSRHVSYVSRASSFSETPLGARFVKPECLEVL